MKKASAGGRATRQLGLPVRGPAVQLLGLPLPPRPMPARQGTRPLKRWRYVGVYGPELMLCVGEARVGPLPQRWWAIALPDGTLRERTTIRRGGVMVAPGRAEVAASKLRLSVSLGEVEGVETVSPSADSWIWTRKQAGIPARGVVELDGRHFEIEAEAVVDESAGYHERRTSWRWSAGVGRSVAGERVAWNLVAGVHDSPQASERSVWIDEVAQEVPPVRFEPDLSGVGGLRFTEWSAREDHTNLLFFRSDYRQPFGTFSGELPGGLRLAEGYGVMESHDVRW